MMTLKFEFVNLIPDEIEFGTLYISLNYCTAIHKCVCGCGNEVVTPISPIDWKIIFDGKTISLNPSIGNWDFNCKSHYWIKQNKIIFARKFNQFEILKVKKKEKTSKLDYFKKKTK